MQRAPSPSISIVPNRSTTPQSVTNVAFMGSSSHIIGGTTMQSPWHSSSAQMPSSSTSSSATATIPITTSSTLPPSLWNVSNARSSPAVVLRSHQPIILSNTTNRQYSQSTQSHAINGWNQQSHAIPAAQPSQAMEQTQIQRVQRLPSPRLPIQPMNEDLSMNRRYIPQQQAVRGQSPSTLIHPSKVHHGNLAATNTQSHFSNTINESVALPVQLSNQPFRPPSPYATSLQGSRISSRQPSPRVFHTTDRHDSLQISQTPSVLSAEISPNTGVMDDLDSVLSSIKTSEPLIEEPIIIPKATVPALPVIEKIQEKAPVMIPTPSWKSTTDNRPDHPYFGTWKQPMWGLLRPKDEESEKVIEGILDVETRESKLPTESRIFGDAIEDVPRPVVKVPSLDLGSLQNGQTKPVDAENKLYSTSELHHIFIQGLNRQLFQFHTRPQSLLLIIIHYAKKL
eukprot:TRINITY_DN12222_c0_g1_i1.p1 TRINITY_DN12222_c0_g1~~TRINITY_DN12222_c0_g1_i1.p1  ORF type:complete len:454 (-),score=99.42 TRINITY_DN12222_c0_g1_i1:79-1440(-)